VRDLRDGPLRLSVTVTLGRMILTTILPRTG
jgi:hypothetical protein